MYPILPLSHQCLTHVYSNPYFSHLNFENADSLPHLKIIYNRIVDFLIFGADQVITPFWAFPPFWNMFLDSFPKVEKTRLISIVSKPISIVVVVVVIDDVFKKVRAENVCLNNGFNIGFNIWFQY